MKVSVLGGGAWGSVLANLAAAHGHEVALWEADAAAARELSEQRTSARAVRGFRLVDGVSVSTNLDVTVEGALGTAGLLVVAIPVAAVRQTLSAIARSRTAAPIVVAASKGLEPETGATMAEVLAACFPAGRTAVLSGPSFAQEVADGLPAALVAASTDDQAARVVQACFGGGALRIYTSGDVTGVCVGGALKNVIAIAVGCCDGFGLGDNARAALITRGLAELGRLAERMGARPLTLAGLAGLGDLVLTCTGALSRNRQVGLALARGESLPAVLAQLGHIAEGVGTAKTAVALAGRLGVDMPITREVNAVLHEGKSPRAVVADLLAREIGAELR